jgi:hypothetical protein
MALSHLTRKEKNALVDAQKKRDKTAMINIFTVGLTRGQQAYKLGLP